MRTRTLLWMGVFVALVPGLGQSQPNQGLESWFPVLRAGMWVKVDGMMRDGALHADEIKIYAGELDEWEIASKIIALDATQLTLKTEFGVLVQASERTELQGPKGNRHIGFAFLFIGNCLEIEGQWQKDGPFIAEEIEVEKSKRLDPELVTKNEHEVTARIESVDAETHSIQVLGVRVYFNQQTRNKSLLLY